LLREIHHRVKNNLQITSSLLRLQAGAVEDPATREVFLTTQNRIRSMALVHEKLYQSTNLARIDFSDYISALGALLMNSMASDRVALQVTGDRVYLSVDVAVPCGLIVNELFSNALKHAFPADRHGTISAHLRDGSDGRCTLTVSDDGVGLPPQATLAGGTTLGLQLIQGLVQQIDGTMTAGSGDGGSGAMFTIVFPKERLHA
jgi:two-component sensor histidine kinase